ncbi:hypothetical protein WQ56_07810 [Luteimonas sp. FCS-9]|nr:hypothetical protein WQ56_07810 [Luteimonas sp. FCS-9]
MHNVSDRFATLNSANTSLCLDFKAFISYRARLTASLAIITVRYVAYFKRRHNKRRPSGRCLWLLIVLLFCGHPCTLKRKSI